MTTNETECEQKLDYCVDVAKQVVAEAEQYIEALTNELNSSNQLNSALRVGLEKAREANELERKNSRTKTILFSVLGGAVAGALLSTQQSEFSMLSGALAGGLVSGGTSALLTSVFEF